MTMIVQPRDGRGYVMIPQSPEGVGYYTYGNPGFGVNQYIHPKMLTLIFAVEREWQTMDCRQFGVGDISSAGGSAVDGHDSHRTGLDVDIRPLRKDGKHIGCVYQDKEYDRAGTEKLINLFRTLAPAPLLILFNDTKIMGVRLWPRHDDHFHMQLIQR